MKTTLWLMTAVAFVVLMTWLTKSEAQSTTPNSNVTLFESNKVAATFAKGGPLVENSDFKVHAARRDAPGISELHMRDTDIFHILEGSAIFVTGGTMVDPKPTSPDEIRGKEIKGGESRRLSKGDVIIVPKGIPHWFKQIDAPMLYYVVKVTK